MKCEICGGESITTIYRGKIKTGLLEGWTKKEYDVYQCRDCKTIWNYGYMDYDYTEFYESKEYRTRIEIDTSIEGYYSKYDVQVLDKLTMTGTDIFRDKTVADIGCGGGSFLDFLRGVASATIAIEPSATYREGLKKRGHKVFAYSSDAIEEYSGKVEVVTSFDVIEHVESPNKFLEEAFALCANGGRVIIGTPTDYPILRKMLGEDFDSFIFQVQHPWVLSDDAMRIMAERIGFVNIKIDYRQKYGIGNLMAWLLERKPRGDIKYDFIEDALDVAYRKSMSKKDVCEYIVLYAEKE